MKRYVYFLPIFLLSILACQSPEIAENDPSSDDRVLVIRANDYVESSVPESQEREELSMESGSWTSYDVPIKVPGRYRIKVIGNTANSGSVWLEDYIHNTDSRTYNITGMMQIVDGVAMREGSPLDSGLHNIKLHVNEGTVNPEEIRFELMKKHQESPLSLTQSMEGEDYELVWSDEFDGTGLPDTTKWAYNVGNWGWGNNELQYYTEGLTKNARQENGSLIIEAHKNEGDKFWTSARLTTQGRVSFLYGKIDFRAKVPVGRGTWSAGWLLGDAYRDEISWPYCGEVDVLECVGHEIDNETGDGINHASCHTRAYYFKQGNQITSTTEVKNMNGEWHTYTVEWFPNVIYMSVDGKRYYTYDKTADELEWPFSNPQNIILNLAIGGGMGGRQGVDPSFDSHRLELDYVRVYELK